MFTSLLQQQPSQVERTAPLKKEFLVTHCRVAVGRAVGIKVGISVGVVGRAVG